MAKDAMQILDEQRNRNADFNYTFSFITFVLNEGFQQMARSLTFIVIFIKSCSSSSNLNLMSCSHTK